MYRALNSYRKNPLVRSTIWGKNIQTQTQARNTSLSSETEVFFYKLLAESYVSSVGVSWIVLEEV